MIIWSAQARTDLISALNIIAEYAGSSIAEQHYRAFMQVLDVAQANPDMGTPCGNNNRQLFPKNYRIVYTAHEGNIYVVTLKHTRQKYP